MNVNWNAKIQKLSDDINFVLNKEKRHLDQTVGNGGSVVPKKAVKFDLPSD